MKKKARRPCNRDVRFSQCPKVGGRTKKVSGELRMGDSVVRHLFEREISGNPHRLKRSIKNTFENGFIAGHKWEDLNCESERVVSTISVSFSHDGQYVASTHGDHTVKVFNYSTSKLVKTFEGHPRTPWSVKFHPVDSNIVVSGCLGSQVRVWHMESDHSIRIHNFQYSIISLSFHPSGEMIAVSTGPQLHMWRWKEQDPPELPKPNLRLERKIKGDLALKGDASMIPAKIRAVKHEANIRAVMFHPNGKLLFIGAQPRSPRRSGEHEQPPPNFCTLYVTSLERMAWHNSTKSGQGQPIPFMSLVEMEDFVHKMHLYSDGGVDISPDGRFIFTSAVLCKPQIVDHLGMNAKHCNNGVFCTRDFCTSNLSLSGRGAPSRSILMQKDSNDSNLPPPPLNGSSAGSSHWSPPPYMEHDGGLNDSSTGVMTTEDATADSLDSADNVSMVVETNTPSGKPTPFTLNPIVQEMYKKARINRNVYGFDVEDSHEKVMYALNDLVEEENYNGGELVVQNAAISEHWGLPAREEYMCRDAMNPTNPEEGWVEETHLCLFRIILPEENDETTPDIARDTNKVACAQIYRALPLTAKLTKAVTSAKISPTGRFALVGYGVRNEENSVVEDHPCSTVACELLNIRNMMSFSIMEDLEDEVNIAQFHPDPGQGLLYGTKKGKLRKFTAL